MKIIIVNCFDTYEHRVDLLHKTFVEMGNEVKVLTSNYRHFKKSKRDDDKKDFILFEAKPYTKNFSYQRLSSHHRLSKDIFEYIENKCTDIDLLWVLVPPNSFVKDASRYKKNHNNVKLIFDLIDLWPETMPIGFAKNVFPFTIWKNLRDRNIGFADCVVTECNLYQDKMKKQLSSMNVKTLYLARPLTPYEPQIELPEDRVSLCYLGSINNIIDIDVIANIIERLKNSTNVELHIIGDGEKREELVQAAERAGATVLFHGILYDRNEKQTVFDKCHYGLNIMKDSVCVGLTMKCIDYFEFGLPIINNIKGDTWTLVESRKIGINYDADFKLEEYNDDFRKNARKLFIDHFTESVFANNVDQIVESL